jgi:hypothetical protein
MVSVVKHTDRRLILRPAEVPSDNRVDRFCPPYRQIIRGMASASPRLADLAVTFPGLAFALATGYGEQVLRERCRAMIESGRPLKDAAGVIGLPFWLKKLPPEAFTQPLVSLPSDAEASRRIASHMPAESWRAVPWFRRVLLAGDLSGPGFAMWMAWRTKQAPRMRDFNRLVLLSAWSWFSEQPGTFGSQLLRQPFHTAISFRKAMEEAEHWRKRIDLAVALGDGLRDTWYGHSIVNGYEFVPLTGIESFLAEASAMDNCLDQYGLQVSLQTTRIFSIRKGERCVADVEIGPHEDDGSVLTIKQLRGPANKRAPAAVWQAAYLWLGQQEPRLGTCRPSSSSEARAAAKRIWGPYLSAMSGRSHEQLLRAFLKSGEVMDPEGA